MKLSDLPYMYLNHGFSLVLDFFGRYTISPWGHSSLIRNCYSWKVRGKSFNSHTLFTTSPYIIGTLLHYHTLNSYTEFL